MSSLHQLQRENQLFRGTGAVSAENGDMGFQPAFMDAQTGEVHSSRFADGRLAPLH